MAYSEIQYDVSEAVATITLDRPARLNAIGPVIGDELIQALAEANDDDAVRAVILTGNGRAFCSGADLSEPLKMIAGEARAPQPRRLLMEPLGRWALILRALEGMQKPLYAAINGMAVGGGMSLALAADIRIASEDARFCAIFARRGLAMEAGTSYLLPRLIGLENTFRMVYSADWVDAAEALRIGLVSEVVPVEKLLDATRAHAVQAARLPTVQLGLARHAIYKATRQDLDTSMKVEMFGLGVASRTFDYHEGHVSFAEKREPHFRGS